ncbi:hypothetical protein CIK05_06055 [Bdellovibrio sp. qaytius]|nr:hypothetical protein CIK05_06055 [Bdellovibrio sp. qaytius]
MKTTLVKILSIFTLLSVLFLTSQEASASQINMPDESCEALDVRDAMNPELHDFFMKPSEQGDIGWCFGYAATDVLSQSIGKPVSSIYVSVNYISRLTSVGKWARELLNGKAATPEAGFIASAINEAKDLGQVCTSEGVPYQGVFKVNSYISRTGTFLTNLQRLRDNKCEKSCEQVVDAGIKYFLSSLQVADVKKYLISNPQLSLEKAFFSLLNSSCGNNRVAVSQNINVETAIQSTLQPGQPHYDASKDIVNKIDSALEKNKVVGLEYNAGHITAAGGTMGGFHASTIIARKTIDKMCHYLVRNSWGSACNYRSGIICEKEQGAYWVDKMTLRKMASKIVWIN